MNIDSSLRAKYSHCIRLFPFFGNKQWIISTDKLQCKVQRYLPNSSSNPPLYKPNSSPYTVNSKCHNPSDCTLYDYSFSRCLSSAHFPLHSCNRRNTWCIQQGKYKKYKCGKRRKQCSKQRYIPAQKNRQRRYNAFFGSKPGNQCGRNSPISKSKRCK